MSTDEGRWERRGVQRDPHRNKTLTSQVLTMAWPGSTVPPLHSAVMAQDTSGSREKRTSRIFHPVHEVPDLT